MFQQLYAWQHNSNHVFCILWLGRPILVLYWWAPSVIDTLLWIVGYVASQYHWLLQRCKDCRELKWDSSLRLSAQYSRLSVLHCPQVVKVRTPEGAFFSDSLNFFVINTEPFFFMWQRYTLIKKKGIKKWSLAQNLPVGMRVELARQFVGHM